LAEICEFNMVHVTVKRNEVPTLLLECINCNSNEKQRKNQWTFCCEDGKWKYNICERL